ncbi:hypothetical protein [Oscillatoria acuminata]|uniref:Uncharacterized protein n=1 Tax=Oscillatoria acuminata PCC 6304 TaxID=56110 RepID=K9TJG6_9CYAN|nr:hypothetical protein [Oscillatoria acuminata]AFY82695.1 hypothetical protein Oscil6304_3113 [Oscillatoria acuminata PCC 6304]
MFTFLRSSTITLFSISSLLGTTLAVTSLQTSLTSELLRNPTGSNSEISIAEYEPPRPGNGKPQGETPGAGTRYI